MTGRLWRLIFWAWQTKTITYTYANGVDPEGLYRMPFWVLSLDDWSIYLQEDMSKFKDGSVAQKLRDE